MARGNVRQYFDKNCLAVDDDDDNDDNDDDIDDGFIAKTLLLVPSWILLSFELIIMESYGGDGCGFVSRWVGLDVDL
jgi:hypothetical protein